MENCNVLEQFKDDEVYNLFLTQDFDVKAVTSSAVKLVAVTEYLAKLSAGISLLDKELHHQVANHYEELLSQATETETLESILEVVHAKILVLLSSVEKLKHYVVDPYEAASNQTVKLVRLQVTCDRLRRIIRIMQICHRLEVQLAASDVNQIIKAAQSINELDYLMEDIDFSEINILEKNLQLIKRGREQLLNQANVLLLRGIEAKSQFDISTALQVFHHLQVLKTNVHQLLQKTKDTICLNIKQALDVQQLSSQFQSAHRPGHAAGNTAAFRSNLWSNMEGLMRNMMNAFGTIQQLQNVLFRKKNPVSHMLFFEELETDQRFDLIQNFWSVITKILTVEFARAANESTFIKQAFEVEFPKLLCMFNDFSRSICEQGGPILVVKRRSSSSFSEDSQNVKAQETVHSTEIPDLLRNALAPFESAYLNRCLSRLIDSVNVMYTGEGQAAPTKEDVEGIVKAMQSELSAANGDALLLKSVSKNVADAINFFVEKCQFLITMDTDSVQVIDKPNAHQILNAQVINLLYLLQKQLQDIIHQNTFNNEAASVIQSSLTSIDSLISVASEPLFHSIFTAVQAILITMHKEEFSIQSLDDISDKNTDSPSSPYMKELENFVVRSHHDYLSLYPDCGVISKNLITLVCSSIEMFVRHVSLIRPLGEGGKMKLASDFAQMETVITTWYPKIGNLGKSYRLLRSFRPLLFQACTHIAMSSAIGDILPYSVVLQFLFSKAPEELQSPHVVAGWTIEEYSKWLNNHPSELERMMLIKGSLDKYVTWVRQMQNKEFCSVYPVILDLLQKGIEAHS